MDTARPPRGAQRRCDCFDVAYQHLTAYKELGMDRRYAEASVLVCRRCGQHWLRYFYEVEAFTASGRWYLGAISTEQAAALTAETARQTLERLAWYFYGGSYFNGRVGKTSGALLLNP